MQKNIIIIDTNTAQLYVQGGVPKNEAMFLKVIITESIYIIMHLSVYDYEARISKVIITESVYTCI